MDSQLLRRAAEWRVQAIVRRGQRARHSAPLQTESLTLTSAAGYTIAARITTVPGRAAPGLVVSPGIHQGLEALHGYGAVVNADELCGNGFTVITFDPAGRGDSWGEEDFGGPEHADNVRIAALALRAHALCNGKVGFLGLSLGIAAATAALAHHPELSPGFLLDWEGPCDREIITSGGTILVPANGHALDDDAYWIPREAVRWVPKIGCPYVRLQALPDHAQPTELRHAMRMMHAAYGQVPWVQLNDHPRDLVEPRPTWLAGGPLAANVAIRRKLRALREGLRG